jgi:hypothetical protein
MATQQSTSYPFICGVAGERGGHTVNPAIDPALFVAPTANFTAFMQSASIGIGYAPGGKLIQKFNGVQYAMPVFKNA